MPFTLSHAIAAWPLWKLSNKRLDLPALAIGTTLPDISYFIALHPVPNIGHSLPGLFIEGLPSGLILLLIGRYLLWRPMLALLPKAIAARLPHQSTYQILPAQRFFVILLSLVAGDLSHIAWDSFTHYNGWSVDRLPWLSMPVFALPLYKWLQYGSGVVGLLLLTIVIGNMINQRSSRPHQPTLPARWKTLAWSVVVGVIALISWVAIAQAAPPQPIASLVIRAVVGIVSGCFLGLCAYASGFWLYQMRSVR